MHIDQLAVALALLVCPGGQESVNESVHYALVDAFPEQADFHQPLLLERCDADPTSVYVVTQPGVIYRIPRDGSRPERQVFLDISERILTRNWEEGLLGLTFDPAFKRNGFIYIYYSEEDGADGDSSGAGLRRHSVIARFHTRAGADGPRVDVDSELRLLVVAEPFGNHNGGTIRFGPDGMLYIAFGDGGKANDPFGNGQNLSTLLGSILRIDVRNSRAGQPYVIPADNPFVGRREPGVRGEIWAYGLRNPWRFSFDRESGALWCGDVGQDRFEEVDRIVKGGNYGWNLMEATHPFRERHAGDVEMEQLLGPVTEYPRNEGISITGGFVYRGRALPELDGQFIFADFGSRRQWAVQEGGDGRPSRVTRLCDAPAPVASYAEDEDGELLLLCYKGRNGSQGRIYRLLRRKPE